MTRRSGARNALSRYAQRLLAAEPDLLTAAERPHRSARPKCAPGSPPPAADDDALMRALRVLRKRVMLRLIARDLGGLRRRSTRSSTTMTALAEVAIGTAVDASRRRLAADYGAPRRRRQRARAAPARHRHGQARRARTQRLLRHRPGVRLSRGRRNATAPRPLSNHEFFTRLGRRLIAHAQRNHRRRLRVPRRHAPAAARRRRPARLQLRHARELFHHAGPRVGALRLDQGAACSAATARRN